MESAWEIASNYGEGITVAVIDTGVEHNHEDLLNVLDGYTVQYSTGKGDPVNPNLNDDAHGTACAGIIGGANNSIGIRGIASNVKILPVNVCTSWNSVYNKYISTTTGEHRFDTSTWKPGIYLIQASNGVESISKKITIK